MSVRCLIFCFQGLNEGGDGSTRGGCGGFQPTTTEAEPSFNPSNAIISPFTLRNQGLNEEVMAFVDEVKQSAEGEAVYVPLGGPTQKNFAIVAANIPGGTTLLSTTHGIDYTKKLPGWADDQHHWQWSAWNVDDATAHDGSSQVKRLWRIFICEGDCHHVTVSCPS